MTSPDNERARRDTALIGWRTKMFGQVVTGERLRFLLCSAWLPRLILSTVDVACSPAMD